MGEGWVEEWECIKKIFYQILVIGRGSQTPPLCYHKNAMLTQTEKFISAIGYLGVLCIIPLLFERKSTFAQHHGKQGLVLLIAWLLIWIGNIIPFLGQMVWVIGSVIFIMLIILGMVNAFAGRLWDMPILGVYAKRIKF